MSFGLGGDPAAADPKAAVRRLRRARSEPGRFGRRACVESSGGPSGQRAGTAAGRAGHRRLRGGRAGPSPSPIRLSSSGRCFMTALAPRAALRATVTCRRPPSEQRFIPEQRTEGDTPDRRSPPAPGECGKLPSALPPTPDAGPSAGPARQRAVAESAPSHGTGWSACGMVEVQVDDAVTGKSLWRSIELQKADPGVRARLLSLALSELIFASWAELLVTPEPAVPRPCQRRRRRPGKFHRKRGRSSVKLPRRCPCSGCSCRRWLGVCAGSEPSVFSAAGCG